MKSRILIITAVALAFAGCTKGGDPDPDPDPGGGHVSYTFSPETVEMDGKMADYVTGVADGAVTFRSGTPASSIPQPGQIILNPRPSDKMPYGFLGRVTAVRQEGGSTVVETEKIPLDQAFEKLDISQSLDMGRYVTQVLDPDGKPMNFSRSASTRGDNPGVSLTIPVKKHEFGVFSIEGSVKLSLELDLDIKVYNNTLTYFDVAVIEKTALTVEAKAAVTSEFKNDDITIGYIMLAPIPVGPVVIVPELRLALYVGASGEVALSATWTYETGLSHGMKYDGAKWSIYKELLESEPGEDPIKTSAEFTIKGREWVGLSTGVFFGVYSAVGVGIRVIPRCVVSSEFKVDAANLLNGKSYADLKESQLKAHLAVSAEAYVAAQLLGLTVGEYSVESPVLESTPFYTKDILPKFVDYDVERDAKRTYAGIELWVGNKLCTYVDIGVALYNADTGARLQTLYDPIKHRDDVDRMYYVRFNGLDPDATYAIRPACKLFGMEFIGDQVITEEKKDDDDSPHLYDKIPDPYLWTIIRDAVGGDGSDVTEEKVKKITSLSIITGGLGPASIASLEGLQYLVNLQEIEFGYNYKLTEIDLSAMKELRKITIQNDHPVSHLIASGPLASLKVKGCAKLEYLWCSGSKIASIDVKGMSSLKDLYLSGNMLTSLDLTGCTGLSNLSLASNHPSAMASLDVSGMTSLSYLNVTDCQLVALYFSGCTGLRHLYCKGNYITQEIPAWFSQLSAFEYDKRYTYTYTDGVKSYTDKGYGWWKPGEPN